MRGPVFGAIGQSHVDPRSGEILRRRHRDREPVDSRNVRAVRSQILAPGPADCRPEAAARAGDAAMLRTPTCSFADIAAEQLAYALELLEARGEIDPASPEAQKFVEDYVRQVTMHEVGHTLGLRHNFRASRVYTEQQLADPEFTAAHGTPASVMEYTPINLNAPGERRALYGTPFNTALGPYDYWAIEYAYRPIAAADEAAELRAHRRRAAPSRCSPSAPTRTTSLGLDPETLQLDLGNDVVAFARKRIAIAQDMLRRQEARVPRPTRTTRCCAARCCYAVQRRRPRGRHAGAPDRRRAHAARRARAAGATRCSRCRPRSSARRSALITGSLLAADSLRVSPALQRRLAPDYLARRDALQAGDGRWRTDFSLATQVLEMQRGLLAALMSDGVARAPARQRGARPAPGGAGALPLVRAVRQRLTQRGLERAGAPRGDIPALRRELQREHVNRVANLLLRPQALSRADARSLLRVQAKALLAQHRRGVAPARAERRGAARTCRTAPTR